VQRASWVLVDNCRQENETPVSTEHNYSKVLWGGELFQNDVVYGREIGILCTHYEINKSILETENPAN
jgi:hypothetical protein